MDIQQLLYFNTVAEEGHMTNAAKILYMSQPALSLSISRLEKEVGMPLFVKSGRNIILTDAGKIFLEFAKKTLDEHGYMQERLSKMSSDCENVIRYGSSSQRSLADSIGDFPEKIPDVKIKYCNYKPETLAQMLLEDKLDLCVTSPPINRSGIHTEIIGEEEILIATSRKSRFAYKSSIALAELKDESFIALNNDYSFRNLCEGFCKQAGFYPNYGLEVNFSTMQEINRNSSLEQNVTFVPKTFCNSRFACDENQVFLHITDVECIRKIGMSWREGKYLGRNLSALMNNINEKYSNL